MPPDGNDLSALSECALHLGHGSVVVQMRDGTPQQLNTHHHLAAPLLGVTCPPGTTAVAAAVDSSVHGDARQSQAALVSLAVNRDHEAAVSYMASPEAELGVLEVLGGPLVDMALRSLGVATMPCDAPVTWLGDGIFVSNLATVLDGGCTSLSWDLVASLHPLAPEGQPVSPQELHEVRHGFARRWSWRLLRHDAMHSHKAACSGEEPTLLLPWLTPAVAAWLDDGAFARMLLASLPYVPETQAAAFESIRLRDPQLAIQLEQALADVCGVTGRISQCGSRYCERLGFPP